MPLAFMRQTLPSPAAPAEPEHGTWSFLGLDRRELCVLAAYIMVLGIALAFYQQSEDEGRAWILCRSFPLHELIAHILRYEGHPALYYVILSGLVHAGVPFTRVDWCFAMAPIGAIYLLLRFSPFPFYLRALLPFGFALGYQYAVDARPYALFPLLGFSVAHLYRRAPAAPLAMAIVLALLANTSIHGTMVAGGFAVAYAFRLLSTSRAAPMAPAMVRQSWLGAGLFAASILFVAFCVWPAKYMDVSVTAIGGKIVRRMIGPAAYERSPSAASPVMRPAAYAPAPRRPRPGEAGYKIPLGTRLHFALVYPVATWTALAVLYEGLVVVFLAQRRRRILLLPIGLLSYFLVAVYAQLWHTGLVWVTLVLILWAAWDTEIEPTGWHLQTAVSAVLALLCVLQLPWTIAAIRYERTHFTWPARAASQYLKTLPPGTRIDGNELAFTVMPFFPGYIFLDHGPERFAGHGNSPADVSIAGFIAERADVILLREANVTPDDRRQLETAGYRDKHTFCGSAYFPNVPTVPLCLAMFEKD